MIRQLLLLFLGVAVWVNGKRDRIGSRIRFRMDDTLNVERLIRHTHAGV